MRQTPYGAYWKSSDFNSNNGDQNVLTNPDTFSRKGGEYIFNLPNGLQGYLITDAKGFSVGTAPTEIVIDPHRLDKGGRVINGVSCMGCHTSGIKPARDEVRDRYILMRKLASAPGEELNSNFLLTIDNIISRYKGNGLINQHVTQDSNVYTYRVFRRGDWKNIEASSVSRDARAAPKEGNGLRLVRVCP